jgi:hypothetical protein
MWYVVYVFLLIEYFVHGFAKRFPGLDVQTKKQVPIRLLEEWPLGP